MQKKAALEAILFAAGDAVSLERLAQALELDLAQTQDLAMQLAQDFRRRGSGLQIVRLGNGYQMCTDSQYADVVRQALDLRRNAPLSQAAMEVLAVVAYNQPVTKSFVEQVRGVDCSGIFTSLVAKGLIEEQGRLELPGRPLLYGTTPDFLRCFGIESLTDLPPLPQPEPQSGEKETVASRQE